VSIISKSLSGIIFNGAALALASAPWKNSVRAIYGFNGPGNGYTVFKPTSNFNSLTQLSQDGVYIVDAATPGFELPGATLTATSTTLLIGIVNATFTRLDDKYLRATFRFKSPKPTANVVISSGVINGDFAESYNNDLASDTDHVVDFPYFGAGTYVVKLGVTIPSDYGDDDISAAYTEHIVVQ